MKKSGHKILRVGFDLDGVLLYNPARIVRPLISFAKKIFLPSEADTFHYPKTDFQRFVWFLLHKSSVFLAPGFDEIKRLAEKNEIQAYIVSGRYESLKEDFTRWLKKIEAKKYFVDCYHNDNDVQPHIFKKRMIGKLKLDIFVEDNWDIVKYLSSSNAKIFWITNLFDRRIPYPYKFPDLKSAVSNLKKSNR